MEHKSEIIVNFNWNYETSVEILNCYPRLHSTSEKKKDTVSILEYFQGIFNSVWTWESALREMAPMQSPCLLRVNWLRDKHSSAWGAPNTNSETRRWGPQRAESWFIRHLVALGVICKPVILTGREKNEWLCPWKCSPTAMDGAREIAKGHLNALEVCCKINSAKIN